MILTAILHALRAYWDYVGSNVAAVPPCALLGFVGGWALRAPLTRWWRKHFPPHPAITEARDAATAAHVIIADLHEQVTGARHPYAPATTPPPGG